MTFNMPDGIVTWRSASSSMPSPLGVYVMGIASEPFAGAIAPARNVVVKCVLVNLIAEIAMSDAV